MKVVSPLSPPTDEQQDNDVRDDSDTGMDGCNAKRRRLHSQTNVIVATTNGHYRHRKHIYPRHDDKSSSSTDCFDTVNGTCNSSSDCDDDDLSTTISRYPDQQNPVDEMASPRRHEHKDNYQRTAIVNNNNCNTEGDCMTSAIRNAVQQLTTNNDNKITLSLSTYTEKNNDSETNRITHEPASSPMEHPIKSPVINEKHSVLVNTADFDDPAAVVANDFVNSETSNDDCLSQSPLNLTRSQGSSEEGGNKSEEDDEYDDDKNSFVNANIEDETMVNGHNLLGTEAPFPWSISPDIISGKHKHNRQDDKIAAQPPQLLLTSGQLNTGCLQAAQLLIPTPRGIMTQTILAIPINDMVASAMTAPAPNQQQLQQQLLYHATNNIRQKNNIANRQQPKQTCPPPPAVSLSLPLNRYFQHQTAADDNVATANVTDDVNSDQNNYDACTDMINNGTIVADQYNNIQRRKWHTPADLPNKKHQFVSPQPQQQQQKHGAKNGERGGEMTSAVQWPKESSAIQTSTAAAAGTNGGDCRIYPTSNNNAAATPTSPPAHGRNGNSCNGGGTDAAVQRQTVWPTAVTGTDQHNDGNENDNEEDKQQQPSHGVVTPVLPTSSTNINNLKSLAPSSSQLNCHGKPSKEDDSASAAAAAAAAYNQQNAICTALATHMLCASQLAAAQQPMFDNLDNSNAVKKPNHIYNNNNNNSKTNNMMGVVNPAVLEKWMMEERYYYNNNNNNNKNIAGGHAHHQRYNAAAAAAAAAAAVELLSGGGVSASSSGGGADSLASCKKRKRRTSFTPHALELLNGHFERNTHPSGSEITGLAHRLGYEREVIRIWFCNKRQALKNTVRTINGSGPVHMTGTKSHNPGGY